MITSEQLRQQALRYTNVDDYRAAQLRDYADALDALKVAREAVDAYYDRFRRFTRGNELFGPIDEEMKALKAALAAMGENNG